MKLIFNSCSATFKVIFHLDLIVHLDKRCVGYKSVIIFHRILKSSANISSRLRECHVLWSCRLRRGTFIGDNAVSRTRGILPVFIKTLTRSYHSPILFGYLGPSVFRNYGIQGFRTINTALLTTNKSQNNKYAVIKSLN